MAENGGLINVLNDQIKKSQLLSLVEKAGIRLTQQFVTDY
jgi:hypothetical protein